MPSARTDKAVQERREKASSAVPFLVEVQTNTDTGTDRQTDTKDSAYCAVLSCTPPVLYRPCSTMRVADM